MVIPNSVMKFQIIYIFEHLVTFGSCLLLTPAAWQDLRGIKVVVLPSLAGANRTGLLLIQSYFRDFGSLRQKVSGHMVVVPKHLHTWR